MLHMPDHIIFPLGDAALTVDFGNSISEAVNKKVVSLFKELQNSPLPGMIEAVPAYSSLTVFYDILSLRKKVPPEKTVFEWMKKKVDTFLQHPAGFTDEGGKLIRIPVCYDHDLGNDLTGISERKKITTDEIVRLHTSTIYRVYMLGFLPGFPYMGEVDERIAVPRKHEPAPVAAGSAGIAGKQTGIYPFDSPGGWQIVGRTPIKLFNKEKQEPTLLNAGDNVQFYSISRDEFENYQSRNY